MKDAIIIPLTPEKFSSFIQKGWALVDLWSTMCIHCERMRSILLNVAPKVEGFLQIGTLCIDDDTTDELIEPYQVRHVPTLLIFHNGTLVEKHIGVLDEEAMMEKFKSLGIVK